MMKTNIYFLFFLMALLLTCSIEENNPENGGDELPPYINSPETELIFNKDVNITPLVFQNTGGAPSQCLVSPDLPSDLEVVVSDKTCVLRGTPTVVTERTTYTFTAFNTFGNNSHSLDIIIDLQVIDNSEAPGFQSLDTILTFYYQKDIKEFTFTNHGGKPVSCEVLPFLPQGLFITTSKDSCKLSAYQPSQKVSNTFTLTGKNIYGSRSITFGLQVIEDPNSPLAPNITDRGWFSLALYKDLTMDEETILNTGGSLTDCYLEGQGNPTPPILTGIEINAAEDGCIISGTPSLVANGSYNIIASNSTGTSILGISIEVKPNDGPPRLGSSGFLPTLYVGSPIQEYLFANTGGAVEFCYAGILDSNVWVEQALPAGLSVIFKNGKCGITGIPTATADSTTYYFFASNQLGSSYSAIGYHPQLTFLVKRADELTTEELLNPVIPYIEGSHSSFDVNKPLRVKVGKYYGIGVGYYVTLQSFGPYPTAEGADQSNINFETDAYSSDFLSIAGQTIPFNTWFTTFQVSFQEEGYYRLVAGFCVSAESIANSDKCKSNLSSTTGSRVIQIAISSSGGGEVSEDPETVTEDLQSKTSEELLVLELSFRSDRLQKAIDNLNTRSASTIEGDLKNRLDSSPTFSSLSTDFPDVVRILEIFKARYEALSTKLNLPVANSDYDKARVAWEWLFPLRNGHIIQFPTSYNLNVQEGEFPYSFRNFLMATALYPNFCGERVGSGVTSSQTEYTRLCTISLAESFAHFSQEVGAHAGDPVPVYNAPANDQEITAAKSGDAGGMKIFECTSIDSQVNIHGFNLCEVGSEIPEWRQALYWVNEANCSETGVGCEYRECSLTTWQGLAWPCPDGAKYFGRGAKQLSYNYNYGPFSEIIYGSVTNLLNKPSKVSEGWLSLASAISFFMQPRPPKPSMFERIYGFWTLPTSLANNPRDANLVAENFASSIMIINGGIECGGTKAKAQAANRVKFYFAFLDFFGLTPTAPQDADSMTCANTAAFDSVHGASYNSYFTEQSWKGGCFLVSYETAYSGFFTGNYEKCIRDIVVNE